MCQSHVRTVYSTANHVTRNEFCAVAKADDLLKVQLDEAWQMATTPELAAYYYRSEEKRALEAFDSRQLRELNMSHDEVAALRVVRTRTQSS